MFRKHGFIIRTYQSGIESRLVLNGYSRVFRILEGLPRGYCAMLTAGRVARGVYYGHALLQCASQGLHDTAVVSMLSGFLFSAHARLA